MQSPFDVLLFNTKLVTAALLLLNFLLLTSLYLSVKWARNMNKKSKRFGTKQQGIVFAMLFAVIVLNGFAVYGNYSLRQATEDLIESFAGIEMQLVPKSAVLPEREAPEEEERGEDEEPSSEKASALVSAQKP